MARLNEPPIPTDNLDILRRKFLRQNRDLARINSTQSLRIRNLENECSRLLSENLDLRGQILRLEKENEDNSAQRIADHAIEIKAKMEAQLVEWGTLLAGLGMEPPTKRRSYGERPVARSRGQQQRSPAQRKLRDVATDLEGLAVQEGRLPPIMENKPYPRATLSRDEILALCSEATEPTDSPELGPPPVSRFVDDNLIKPHSPIKGSPDVKDELDTQDVPSHLELPSPSRGKRAQVAEESPASPKVSIPAKLLGRPAPASKPEAIRPGSKRKFGISDESVGHQTAKLATTNLTATPGDKPRPFPTRESQTPGATKYLDVKKRVIRDKPTQAPRKVLGSKSTNENMGSPKKSLKEKSDATVAPKPTGRSDGIRHKPQESGTKSLSLAIPELVLATVDNVLLDLAESRSDLAPVTPETPEHASAARQAQDTPPPNDISATGEVPRPGRRARPAISYAEPNLRDKMRRPTKELFDAVAGEGKFLHRSSISHKTEDLASLSAAGLLPGSEDMESRRSASAAGPPEASVGDTETASSSIADRPPLAEILPSTVVTNRRKRTSSAARESLGVERPVVVKQENLSGPTGGHGAPARSAGPEFDVYEFMTSSPVETNAGSSKGASTKGATAKSSRRSSAAQTQAAGSSRGEQADKTAKQTASRKRASMAVPSKTPLMDWDDEEDVTPEVAGVPERDDGGPLRDRISRRRSMML